MKQILKGFYEIVVLLLALVTYFDCFSVLITGKKLFFVPENRLVALIVLLLVVVLSYIYMILDTHGGIILKFVSKEKVYEVSEMLGIPSSLLDKIFNSDNEGN